MSKDLASPIIKKTAIDKDGVAHYLVEGGLTKRELFAMHIYASGQSNAWQSISMLDAIRKADELLAKLSSETKT